MGLRTLMRVKYQVIIFQNQRMQRSEKPQLKKNKPWTSRALPPFISASVLLASVSYERAALFYGFACLANFFRRRPIAIFPVMKDPFTNRYRMIRRD